MSDGHQRHNRVGSVLRRLLGILLLAGFLLSANSVGAEAPAEGEETAYAKKQRRLNIAGWTLVGAGIAFPVIMAPLASTRDTNCEVLECPVYGFAVTSYLLGPMMVISGSAMLLKRRGLRKQHERQTEVAITAGLTGFRIVGRF